MSKVSTKGAKQDKKIEEFKERISKEAENFLHVVFPEKVKELDAMLQSDLFSKENVDIHHDLNIPLPPPATVPPEINGQEDDDVGDPSSSRKRPCADGDDELTNKKPRFDGAELVAAAVTQPRPLVKFGTPVYTLPNGQSPSNAALVRVIEIVKPLIKALVEQTNSMKMWILFLIPKIEDGNNFGVSVQEETLGEVRQVESESATYLDQLSRYFITRGKLVSKLAKYPHIEDYRRAIDEIDEKEYLSLKLTVAELRNNYSSLHDLIIKNLDKITTPRTSTNMHIY